MGKHKAKPSYKPGDAIHIPVNSDHINESDPCNKDNCMLTRGFTAWLADNYGDRKFGVKSTNHGVTFDLNERRYTAVFDNKTAFKIYNYDQTYRQTKSKDKARATVRPFKARVMIEAGTAITHWPSMSEDVKKKLRAMPKKKDATYRPKKGGSRRELSL